MEDISPADFENNELVIQLAGRVVEEFGKANFPWLLNLRKKINLILQDKSLTLSQKQSENIVNIVTLLEFHIFPMLKADDALDVIKHRLIRLIRMEPTNPTIRYKIFHFLANNSDDIFDFKLRKNIINNLENNEELLGSRTVSWWLKDFLGFSNHRFDPLWQITYLNTIYEVKGLDIEEREILQKVFQLYYELHFEPSDPRCALIDIRKNIAYWRAGKEVIATSPVASTPFISTPSLPVTPTTTPKITPSFPVAQAKIEKQPEETAVSWRKLEQAMAKEEEPEIKQPVIAPPVAPAAPRPSKPPAPTPPTISTIRTARIIRTSKPLITDIKAPPEPEGPLEELKELDLKEFRRLGQAREATAKIKNKIELLAEESFAKKAEGIRTWQTSLLNKLYLEVGQQAIEQGRAVADILASRQDLTLEEFEAIADLNRELRF